MEEEQCAMCKAGQLGAVWTRDILMGKKSVHQACTEFAMDLDDVQIHVNEHEIQVDEESGGFKSPDFYLNELLRLYNRQKSWLEYVIQSGQLDMQKMNMAIKLSRETRETIQSLAMMQGRMTSGSVHLQIQNTENRVLMLTNVILEEVCEPCKVKVLRAIEQTPLLGGT